MKWKSPGETLPNSNYEVSNILIPKIKTSKERNTIDQYPLQIKMPKLLMKY